MAFVINQNFELKSRRKDFARQELALADLPGTLDADYPDDYIVAIGGEIYIFNSANTKDAKLGKWRKLETGAQLSPSLEALKGLPVLEIELVGSQSKAKPFDRSTVDNGTQILIVIHLETDIYHLGYVAHDGYYFFDRDGNQWMRFVVDEDNNVTQTSVPLTVAWPNVSGKPAFSTVATSGSYNDLSDKPAIPAAQVQSDWNATSGVAAIKNKPTIPAAQVQSDWNATAGMGVIKNKPALQAVATSGSYNDLTDKPAIPEADEAITNDEIDAVCV